MKRGRTIPDVLSRQQPTPVAVRHPPPPTRFAPTSGVAQGKSARGTVRTPPAPPPVPGRSPVVQTRSAATGAGLPPPPTRFGAAAPPVQKKTSVLSPRPAGRPMPLQRMEDSKMEEEPLFTHVQYAAKQSEQRHIVSKDWESNKGKTKIDKMYPVGSTQIREKRSFAGERPKQILRWLATTIFAQFPTAVEIQCYFDGEFVWISSNKSSVNKNMLKAYKDDIITALGGSAGTSARETRHKNKLLTRGKYEVQQGIYDALVANKIKIPTNVVKPGGIKIDLHAERRIQLAIGGDLNPQYLAGVKRPCLICALALKLVGARPGPTWTSGSALGGYDLDKVLEHAVANEIITYVTRDRVLKTLTTDHDTDSESGEDN